MNVSFTFWMSAEQVRIAFLEILSFLSIGRIAGIQRTETALGGSSLVEIVCRGQYSGHPIIAAITLTSCLLTCTIENNGRGSHYVVNLISDSLSIITFFKVVYSSVYPCIL